MASKSRRPTTIIFDVDDTLYDVSTGFTAHRNGDVIWRYMVEHLGFPNKDEARAVRDSYFSRYHSTAKALTEAQKDGKFPKGAPTFNTQHMSQYWADHLDYSKLGGPKHDVRTFLESCPLQLVAFSNGPRQYIQRALEQLGLWELFGSGERVFCVDDVLPYCKPEKEAFQIVFDKLGIKIPDECIMVEDSMKNVRWSFSVCLCVPGALLFYSLFQSGVLISVV